MYRLRVRRPLFVLIAGLAIAFGIFYLLSWPSTLTGPKAGTTDGGSFSCLTDAPSQTAHAVLGPFRVAGSRGIDIVRIGLLDPSSDVELEQVRMGPVNSPQRFLPQGGDQLEDLPSAAGSFLPPNKPVRLFVTYRIEGPTGQFGGLRIRYRSGWLTRDAVLGQRAGC